MNFSKGLTWIAVVALLYFTGALQYVASLSQKAVLISGAVDASAETNDKHEPFDFNFTIKDLSGKKISFKDFEGKVVFLNLWATWCGPCRGEMPTIQELYNEVDKDKVLFVILSLDRDTQMEKVNRYVASGSYTFPVFMPSGYLTEQLQVPSIPTTFVIAKDGTIALKQIGMKNYNTNKFKKFLNDLVSQ